VEAFVYCWYNIESNKKYIGYHKGTIDDGYVSSSGNPQFWIDYESKKLKRQIVAKGTVKDCQKLERTLFENVDWKSDEYYNIAVGGSVNFALNNPMYRKEIREKIGKIHKGKVVSEETRKRLSKAQTGRKYSDETKEKHRKNMMGNNYAVGNILSKSHKEILREKALNNNPMNNPEYVEKIRQSKIGTVALYKNGFMKKAKPNSEKWNTLILDGWLPKDKG